MHWRHWQVRIYNLLENRLDIQGLANATKQRFHPEDSIHSPGTRTVRMVDLSNGTYWMSSKLPKVNGKDHG